MLLGFSFPSLSKSLLLLYNNTGRRSRRNVGGVAEKKETRRENPNEPKIPRYFRTASLNTEKFCKLLSTEIDCLGFFLKVKEKRVAQETAWLITKHLCQGGEKVWKQSYGNNVIYVCFQS